MSPWMTHDLRRLPGTGRAGVGVAATRTETSTAAPPALADNPSHSPEPSINRTTQSDFLPGTARHPSANPSRSRRPLSPARPPPPLSGDAVPSGWTTHQRRSNPRSSPIRSSVPARRPRRIPSRPTRCPATSVTAETHRAYLVTVCGRMWSEVHPITEPAVRAARTASQAHLPICVNEL